MSMPSGVRTFALAVHLVVSVGWLGAAVAYLALGVTAAVTDDGDRLRSAWTMMELIGWSVLVPLAVLSLITGLVMALGTTWGLFRHYWVLFSFVLTVAAAAILLLHMPQVSALAAAARGAEGSGHLAPRLGEGDVVHPALGVAVLLVVHVLNVYKPRGIIG